MKLADCPGPHTPAPSEYQAWHCWAERKNRTHRQVKCPRCGLLAIWVPRKRESA